MDSHQAKQILLLHRPGLDDPDDPEIRAALDQAKRDPDLGIWFEQHCASQNAIRAKFREIAPPPDLKQRILAEHKILKLPLWQRRPFLLAVAAAIALLAALASLWLPSPGNSSFSEYRARMVRTALRDYRMNMLTRDLDEIRAYLRTNTVHGDYVLSEGLKKLPGEGCALLRWQDKPVSLICFESEKRDTLFLFIINRSAFPRPPALETPQFTKISKLMTASWIIGDKTYLLAGSDGVDLSRYAPKGP
jgi:hypothetical protein